LKLLNIKLLYIGGMKMGKWKYYTPDGVADILPEECSKKRVIEKKLRKLFSLSGYREIETPGLEFYDVYASGEGFAPQEGMFKFFDHQGRILSLRYDGTIPAVRVASTLMKETKPPLRLSYIGNMYRYNEIGGGKQREFTQAGIELMGPNNSSADAQVISTAIDSALICGITDLQVSLGNVEFFKGLTEEWNVGKESVKLLLKFIDGKETVALEDLSEELGLNENAKTVLLKMTSSYGTFDLIEEMKNLVTNKRSLEALDNLKEVLEILSDMDLLKYVSLDLGMLQSLDYYTGIIFKGFTYGIGFPLFSGGRYDNVASEFGRDLPATGFSIGINFVMNALRIQMKETSDFGTQIIVGYDEVSRKKAFDFAKSKRAENIRTELDCLDLTLEKLKIYAKSVGVSEVYYIDAQGSVINNG